MLRDTLANAFSLPTQHLPTPVDAVGDSAKSAALGRVMTLKIARSEGTLRRALPLLKKAARLIHAYEYREAARIGLKALDIDETIALGNHITAIALDKMGCPSLALELYERALKLDPEEPEVYQNLGLLAWRMQLYEVAEKFFRIFIRLMPEALEGPNNLACVLRDQGRFNEAIEVLRAAIYANQSSALLWNSLGTVMMEQTEFDQAILFYREALNHEADLPRVHHNIGYCNATQGEHVDALSSYDAALANTDSLPPSERAECQHARSTSLIALGDLGEGWRAYMSRHDPSYAHTTHFDMRCARWDGGDITGRRVLIVGEQGLGDEVMFLNQAHDMMKEIGPDGHLTIAATPRLVPLFERSFPQASVLPHATVRNNGLPLRGIPGIESWSDYDVWAPMGDFLTVFRDDVQRFPASGGFLTPDPDRVTHWREELNALGSGYKAGLLWKSLLMSAKRTKYYSPFQQWEQSLKTEGVTWVNLQYGDCDEDLAIAADRFGVKIHQLEGIDLRNDLDDLAALCVALDLVAGPMNATTNIAAGSGARTAIIAAPRAWPYLGTTQLPWYPTARVFSPETLSDWRPAMADFQAWLEAEIETADGARKVA